ncbi:MAG TPA: hypothetical protein VFO76_06950 [Candidatus Kapabacteria bacterium]|nr:hypothetical protein [Candidatus Kapabacteria bacterium]
MSSVSKVFDSSFFPESIETTSDLLRGSKRKINIFREVYRGNSKKPKTVSEIAAALKMKTMDVAGVATHCAREGLFERIKVPGEPMAFKSHDYLRAFRNKIINIASKPKSKSKLVTMRTRSAQKKHRIEKISIRGGQKRNIEFITINDIDNFREVRKIKDSAVLLKLSPECLSERRFNNALVKIIKGTPLKLDWGGEDNDLFTTNCKISGKRYACAIALKGPAINSKTLHPKHMGKNGDQIVRMFFNSPANVFFIQFEGTIHESIIKELQMFAIAKSQLVGQKIFYGIIDHHDSYKLRIAYKKEFK